MSALVDYISKLVSWIATHEKTPGVWRDDAAAEASHLRRYDRMGNPDESTRLRVLKDRMRDPRTLLGRGPAQLIVADTIERLATVNPADLIAKPRSARAKRRQMYIFKALFDPFAFYASREGYETIIRELNNSRKLYIDEEKKFELIRDDPTVREALTITPEQPIQAL